MKGKVCTRVSEGRQGCETGGSVRERASLGVCEDDIMRDI